MSAEYSSAGPTARQPWPLHVKFGVAGSGVVMIGMALVGWWVSRAIEESVTRNSGITTALYMESFIAPLSQELNFQNAVSRDTSRKLRALFDDRHLADRIASIKLWKEDGLVVFSTDSQLIGEKFEPSEALLSAWDGRLTASFNDLNDPEDVGERDQNLPLLEVYNPIRSIYNGEVIAVAEFYQVATELQDDLLAARISSWLAVAGVFSVIFALLFGIVYRASQLIQRQRTTLEQRLAQISRVSAQNDSLRRRIQAASARAIEFNERYLRRISAELHDGPAQSLAFASLRINSLADRDDGPAKTERASIKTALDEALGDIRNICRGLSLPELKAMNLKQVVIAAVQAHRKRTNEHVGLSIVGEPGEDFDHPARICVFRFIQEALNNASRHAGGKGARVLCTFGKGAGAIRVSDSGPGFTVDSAGGTYGLGLDGLRERIESHGGSFCIKSTPGRGASIRMTINAKESGHAT